MILRCFPKMRFLLLKPPVDQLSFNHVLIRPSPPRQRSCASNTRRNCCRRCARRRWGWRINIFKDHEEYLGITSEFRKNYLGIGSESSSEAWASWFCSFHPDHRCPRRQSSSRKFGRSWNPHGSKWGLGARPLGLGVKQRCGFCGWLRMVTIVTAMVGWDEGRWIACCSSQTPLTLASLAPGFLCTAFM